MKAQLKIGVVITTILAVYNVQAVKIAISHFNDINGQIESFVKNTQRATDKAPMPCTANQECIGGLTSLVHWLYEEDAFGFQGIPSTNILRLSSGNLAGEETGWLPSIGSTGWTDFGFLVRNSLNPTALSLGLKDFEAGLDRTKAYMNESEEYRNPIFTLANTCEEISYYDETEERFCNLISKNRNLLKRIEVEDTDSAFNYTIGIIGFVTPIVERLSSPGKLKFGNVVETIKEAAVNSDIKTIIAIGDVGDTTLAKQIIDEVPKVKLVIFGSGSSIVSNMSDEYPVANKQGFLATAGRYGSAIGKLVLDINRDSGNVTVLNATLAETTIPESWNDEAQMILPILTQHWSVAVHNQKLAVLGDTRVELPGGENCWREECNIGNLVADAMVHCIQNKIGKPFQFPIHSIWHGGAFSKDIFRAGRGISKFDVMKWLPYPNKVHLVKVHGNHLWQIFQQSASGIDPAKANAEDWGQLLQVSNGIQVYYDTSSGAPTLARVRIQNDVNDVPRFEDLQVNSSYYLAISTYLYDGRGVYEFAKTFWNNVIDIPDFDPELDETCLHGYIRAINHVSVGIEERIHIDIDSDGNKNSAGLQVLSGSGKAFLIASMISILGSRILAVR